jgi:glucose dehydrogenase
MKHTPIVVDGMMFITAPWSVVFALDAKSGKEIWSFDPEADKPGQVMLVAMWLIEELLFGVIKLFLQPLMVV